MGMKLVARIRLPYVIRLEKHEKIYVQLPEDKEFSYCKVSFLPTFREKDETSVCDCIEVEAILNNYDHTKYPKNKAIQHNDSSIRVLEMCEVSDEETAEIFKVVRSKLNKLFLYVNQATGMFWVEDIPLNPISSVISTRSDFRFSHPENTVEMESWKTIFDDFMVDLSLDDIKVLNNNLLKKYKDTESSIWTTYINKAHKSIYLSEYEDFIIYSAIAAESFIKQLVNNSASKEDIIFKKLTDVGKSQMVETYFRHIMKHLYDVDLYKVETGLFNNLKSIFSLRNDIMHKGFMSEKSYKNAGINKLEFKEASKMFFKLNKTLEKCLEIARNNKSLLNK